MHSRACSIPFRTALIHARLLVVLVALLVCVPGAWAQVTYQTDNGSSTIAFNNCLSADAQDSWVANVFTGAAGATRLNSVAFRAGLCSIGGAITDLNASTMPSAYVTAALYTGAPGAGLTLVPGSVNTVPLDAARGTWVTVPFAVSQFVAPGQVFTAALLIRNTPWNVFPFRLDTSGSSAGSYYDVASPVGSVNAYDLASPNHPTLNGDPYPGSGGTNAGAGKTLLRVNADTARVLYVSPAGTDANDGLSWATAKASVNAALAGTLSGDQVWVAAGTYTTHAAVPAGVGLYGGFAGSETDLAQRNPAANVTTLDGGGSGTVLYVLPGKAAAQTVDGFTVTHGQTAVFIDQSAPVVSNNRIVDNTNAWNSGIFGMNCAARVLGNYLTRNTGYGDGGGMLFVESSPDIEGNTITQNTGRDGGGINLYRCGDTRVIGNTITENSAQVVGGIIVNNAGGVCTITGNTLAGNASTVAGEGALSIGGAARVVVTNNAFTGNRTPNGVGGLSTWGSAPVVVSGNTFSANVGTWVGGLVVAGSTEATVDGNTVSANTASGGTGGMELVDATGSVTNNGIAGNTGPVCGGLWTGDSVLAITGNNVKGNTGTATVGGVALVNVGGVFANNRVVGNHGAYFGGMVHNGSAAPVLYNLFADNVSGNVSGGLEIGGGGSPTVANNVFTGNQAIAEGAIGISIDISPRIINNTIVGNSASFIGGINAWHCTPLIANNIIAFNVNGGVSQTTDASATLSHNCVYGNTGYDYDYTVTPGATDIQVDPLLTNPPGVVRLKNTSPCVDAGDDSLVDPSWTDYSGNPRRTNARVDIGAYELQGKPKAP